MGAQSGRSRSNTAFPINLRKLASDISQNMTAAMPKNVKAGFMVLALLMTFVTFIAADCPDAGIRCRIPASDADTTGSSSGCSGGGSASGGATGDVPTGMISIDGMCYNSETDSDQTTFAVIGDITIGQCYNAIEGGCQPEHCPGNSAGLRCNQQVKACTVNGQTECEGKKVSG